MAANSSLEGGAPVVPRLTYLGSTRTLLSAEDLKQEPRVDLPPGFSFPAASKQGPLPGRTKAGKGKGAPGKAKKGGAKAAARLLESSGGSQANPATTPAHPGKAPADVQKAGASGRPASAPFSQPAIRAQKLTESEARELERRAAATRIDYSKWEALVDSDDERSDEWVPDSGHREGDSSEDEVDEYGWVYDEDKGADIWSPTGKTIKRSEAVARGQFLQPPSDEFFERWSRTAEGKAAFERFLQASDSRAHADGDGDKGANMNRGLGGGRSQAQGTAQAKGRPIDYSKWDTIVDSDEERERAAAEGGCCRHCKCCYPDANTSDSDECSDGAAHARRNARVHTVPGRTRDDSPQGRTRAATKTRGRGTRADGGRRAGEPPPSLNPRAGHSRVSSELKHAKGSAVGSHEGESAAKKPGLKGGFFAPKAAAKTAEGAPAGSGHGAGDAGPQKASVEDLRIYHKLGGTAKPLTAYPLKNPEEQKNWRTYIHSDGRLYFVHVGSSGLGTWWKPDELLDVTEAQAGWQELYDKTGRAYFYCPSLGCSQDTEPHILTAARQVWHDGSCPRVDLMAEAAWEDICEQALGAATPEEAAERAIAAMASSRFFPAVVTPGSQPDLYDTIRKRMRSEWLTSRADAKKAGPRGAVGDLTDFLPKFPDRHHRWRSYKHADGRFYFVRSDDPGPGTWYRPEDLLDIPEFITGWQQIPGRGPGPKSFYHAQERRSEKALPAVLAKARLLQEHCPFLTPLLAASSFPAFAEHMEQAKTEEHAERLATEALATYLIVPPPAVRPAPQPRVPSSGAAGTKSKTASSSSGPANRGARKEATGAAKAVPAKQGGAPGPRINVDNWQLTRYRRMQPQQYYDWQAYKHVDGRLYFVRASDPGPGTWRKPYDLQDATEGLSGWQELEDADGRTYYWHDGQQRRTAALPEELRQARDLVDRGPGENGPLPAPADVLNLVLTAKTREEVTEGIMRSAMTSGMTAEDRATMERLVTSSLAGKWPQVPETTAARDKALGDNVKPSGAAAKSGATSKQPHGKGGTAGPQAGVSRSKGEANGTRNGAAGARAEASSGAGGAHSDDEAAPAEGGAWGKGYREGPGGQRVKVCWSCGKDETAAGKFKKCDGCVRARYCSRDCQRDHWKSHKDECREWAAEKLKRNLAAHSR